jgi:hypothetical protein
LSVGLSVVAAALLALRWLARLACGSGGSRKDAQRRPTPTSKKQAKRDAAAAAAAAAQAETASPTDAVASLTPVDDFDCNPPAWVEDGGGLRATPLWAGYVTLLVGYVVNLVPYELIERSKFIYHYIPDLLVGILLLSLCVDTLWAWALPRGGRAPVAPIAASRARLVAVLCGILGVAAAVGYAYWGIPFVHGMRLTDDEERAREWHEKWSTRLPPGVVDTSVLASFDR